jgi:uncharacterized protein (DUF58 family)
VLLRPPRRLHVLRPVGFLIFGTFALGLATLNTGNNLLYLLLGALLGTIALSGWLSEQALRGVHVQRTLPRSMTAGSAARMEYTLRNTRSRLPSHGLVVRELGRGRPRGSAPSFHVAPAFVALIEAGAVARVSVEARAERRGVYPLDTLALETSFPFGLFTKGRDRAAPASLVVWPRTDRPVRPTVLAGAHRGRRRVGSGAAAGAERGDYRGLREYRPGDDTRDIHWRSTARRGEPITREYERDASDEYWIVLDTTAPDEAAGELAVELAASLVVAAAARGDRFGFAAGAVRLPPGSAAGRVEAVLDVLAAVELSADGPGPVPPAAPAACVFVTARSAAAVGWGDVYTASADAPAGADAQ